MHGPVRNGRVFRFGAILAHFTLGRRPNGLEKRRTLGGTGCSPCHSVRLRLALCKSQENYETRKNTLRHRGFLLFLTPSALSAAVSEYQAVANGCVTP
jgi:hypothetical protein